VLNGDRYKELLGRFYCGTTTAAEEQELSRYSRSDRERYFREYSDAKWSRSSASLRADKTEQLLGSMLSRIEAYEEYGKTSRRRHRLRMLYIVTSAAMIALGVTLGYRYGLRAPAIMEYEVVAERGQKSTVTMPDGTRIWLNSDSRLRYTSDFNRKDRHVTLEGEGYFEVATVQALPFVVTANEMRVTALGTKFDVKAYSNDAEIVATLVEGKIETVAGDEKMIVLPNSRASYNRGTGKMRTETLHYSDHAIPWRNNELVIEGESLGEISMMLERMYNVEIVFSDKTLTEYRYRGLVRNSTLSNVLSLISSTSPVEYKIYGNTIKFSRKQ